MFEGDAEAPLVAAARDNVIADVGDSWYRKRFREVTENAGKFSDWKIVNDQLYYLQLRPVIADIVEDLDRWKLMLPDELRGETLRESHDDPQAGYLSVEKTYHRLVTAYYWPGMFRETTKYTCQRTKVEQTGPAGLTVRRVVEVVVAADIMEPLPRSRSGFAYILALQDLFTK